MGKIQNVEDQLRIETILEEIRNWLENPSNRDELIVLYLDVSANLKRWKQEEALSMAFWSILGDRIVLNNDTRPLLELVRSNKRIIVVSRRPIENSYQLFHFTGQENTC